jgi:ATP-dependent helicase/nuclease subunit B
MQVFLEKLALFVHQHYGANIQNLCLVLPNKRAKLFLKNHLASVYKQPIWAPTIFSIEDFIVELSGAENLDSLSSAFEFYAVYKSIEKENAQAFDDFLQWAPTLLNDFNEIDQYLVDAAALFAYLSDDHALSLWNPNGEKLTDFQLSYLRFWKSLAIYYNSFKQHLTRKNLFYSGLAYRKVAENAVELANSKTYSKIIFSGFNALNTAEKRIVKDLCEAGIAEILWDADDYYLKDENQEAGKFIREFSKYFGKFTAKKEFLWNSNALLTESKRIVIAGVAQQISQAKVAATFLEEIADSTQGNFKNCALVLADENLLLPVLHSIPSVVDKFNVTMGYPIHNLALAKYIDLCFALQKNAVKYSHSNDTNKVRFYFKDLKNILLHSYTYSLLFQSENRGLKDMHAIHEFIRYLDKQNISFISFSELKNRLIDLNETTFSSLAFLFIPWENSVDVCLNALLQLLDSLKQTTILKNTNPDPLELEVLFHFTKITKRIFSHIKDSENTSIKETKTIQAIFDQLVRQEAVAFIGEPLEGLQIMGMLETRTLDFETVVLLSANEGILPAGKKENSFVPLELKSKFGLPTYSDKDAIFGYHFYRLMQCAKTIYLVYNTETDEFGSGEKSRFITQLQQEMPFKNKNIRIEEKLFTIPLNSNLDGNKIEIAKNAYVFEKIKKRMDSGMSPSLFNSYRNCSLQFYFKYIAGLRELEEPDESIDAATFGTVMHEVLEENYKPLIGKELNELSLKNAFNQLPQKVDLAFQKAFKSGNLTAGKNLLNVKIAVNYLKSFLKEELTLIRNSSEQNQKFTLLHLEHELKTQLPFRDYKVELYGKADRIDQVGNCIRIVDYKTGAVDETKELKLKDWPALKEVKRNKAFQLLMYAYLFAKNQTKQNLELNSGIISFRELSKGLKMVSFAGEEKLDVQILKEFEGMLYQMLDEIFDTGLPFKQTKDTAVCEYCDYKSICNR